MTTQADQTHCERFGGKMPFMKSALVVVLIVLLVGTGLPIVMSMDGMGLFPECLTGPSAQQMGLCLGLGLLAAVFVLTALAAFGNGYSPVRPNYGRPHALNLLRPPRVA